MFNDQENERSYFQLQWLKNTENDRQIWSQLNQIESQTIVYRVGIIKYD